ncbi:unnamed protein product [Moneuplotes crassus]|uniref:Uncharacterized protein n=1 Tax=Euplotes crassus TaxID=5936 RepID=A0AAD1U1M4_EUPCR|nr:unnamed protein product [Moneuplotes crassus]
MISYRRMYTRFVRHWDKVRMYYEHGLTLKPENYEAMKLSHLDYRTANIEITQKRKTSIYREALQKFYKRYPDVKYSIARDAPGLVGKRPENPALLFIEKQMKLMDKGYSENKAFEILEKEMAEKLEVQRDENRILRGFAINNRARSYLNYSQQLSEAEGKAKVDQLDRDLPKYLYQQQKWDIMAKEQGTMEENQRQLIENRGSIINETFKNLDYTTESAEQYFSQYVPTSKLEFPFEHDNYQPATYEVVKHAYNMKDKESLIEVHDGFINRAESLIKAHKYRASLADGLKGLSDREIIQKVREVPTRIKKNSKSLVKKLEKMNVRLNDDGSVNYSQVPYPHVVKSLQKMEGVVKIALMHKDLEFEYPQHFEKLQIKGDMMKMINAEEMKLEQLKLEKEIKEKADPELSYEQYFESLISDKVKDINVARTRGKDIDSKTETELIFEKDLEERAGLFIEDDFEREKRLREMWIDLKRKNVIGGPDARTTDEQFELQELIVDKIRDLRWKIDQEMVKQDLDPIFKKAYHKYTKDEFMYDADLQFSKLKSFLSKNPRVLKEDEIIGQEYLGIIQLIRRKKLLEYSTPAYAKEHELSYDAQIAMSKDKTMGYRKDLIELEKDQERLDLIDQKLSERDIGQENDTPFMENQTQNDGKFMSQFERASK